MSMSPAPLISKPATTTPSAVTEEQRQAACRTVAHYSNDVDELRELLRMLDLQPKPRARRKIKKRVPVVHNPGRCRTCDCLTFTRQEMAKMETKPANARRYGGKGECSTCHRRTIRGKDDGVEFVDSARMLQHISALRDAGLSFKKISRLAGANHLDRVAALWRKQPAKVLADTADAILSIEIPMSSKPGVAA